MNNRGVLAIGTSAGGVAALRYLAQRLPPDFPAAILVTLHLATDFKSSLDELIDRAGPLPAKFASDGEPAAPGTIYLAPPDRHLLIDQDLLWLGRGPRENNSRPAIDPMLRSLAACCGSRAVGVVLTGTLGDGASGLWTVGRCGGRTVVQDPDDAAFGQMPLNAIRSVQPDHVAPLADLPALLSRLVHEPAGTSKPAPPTLAMELMIARGDHMAVEEMERVGRRAVFAGPGCHAVSFAPGDDLRRAMATALRALEERVALARTLQYDADARRQPHAASEWERRVNEFQQEFSVIEGAIQRMDEIAALGERQAGSSLRQSVPLFRAVPKG